MPRRSEYQREQSFRRAQAKYEAMEPPGEECLCESECDFESEEHPDGCCGHCTDDPGPDPDEEYERYREEREEDERDE